MRIRQLQAVVTTSGAYQIGLLVKAWQFANKLVPFTIRFRTAVLSVRNSPIAVQRNAPGKAKEAGPPPCRDARSSFKPRIGVRSVS